MIRYLGVDGAAATIRVEERFGVAEDDLRRRCWSDDLGGREGQPPLEPEDINISESVKACSSKIQTCKYVT